MAKTDFKTVDAYIATLTQHEQADVQAVRAAILSAVPSAEEVISYQIPAFKSDGWIFYISAHKEHYALACPPVNGLFEAFAAELKDYALSKSVVKLPKNQPLPLDLIKTMSAWQVERNQEKLAKKGGK